MYEHLSQLKKVMDQGLLLYISQFPLTVGNNVETLLDLGQLLWSHKMYCTIRMMSPKGGGGEEIVFQYSTSPEHKCYHPRVP